MRAHCPQIFSCNSYAVTFQILAVAICLFILLFCEVHVVFFILINTRNLKKMHLIVIHCEMFILFSSYVAGDSVGSQGKKLDI